MLLNLLHHCHGITRASKGYRRDVATTSQSLAAPPSLVLYPVVIACMVAADALQIQTTERVHHLEPPCMHLTLGLWVGGVTLHTPYIWAYTPSSIQFPKYP